MKRNRFAALLLALMLMLGVLAGCSPAQDTATTAPAQTASEAPVETPTPTPEPTLTPEPTAPPLAIKNAKNFNIEYMADSVKLVTDSDGRKLLLVPEGVTAPAGYEDAVQITTPIKHAMYTSTTHVGYLGSLEDDTLYDSIAAVTTVKEDWTTPQVLERFESGQITHVVQDMTNAGDIEKIVEIAPDIVFSGGGDEAGVKQRAQLDEAQIKYAVVTEWTEADAKASLEWIKFFAAFFNKDAEADAIYEAKLARMEELYTLTAGIAEADRPVVAYGLVYNGVVYTQGGTSTFVQEIEKAGAVYALKDVEGDGSVQLGMEEFLDKAKDADILIYGSLPQYLADKAALLGTEPLFSEFKAFQNDQVYIFDKGYYMNSAKVVEKFEDIVSIFNPDLLPGHVLSMYQKLPGAVE